MQNLQTVIIYYKNSVLAKTTSLASALLKGHPLTLIGYFSTRQAKTCLQTGVKYADSDHSHPGFCSLLIHCIVFNDSVSGQRRL